MPITPLKHLYKYILLILLDTFLGMFMESLGFKSFNIIHPPPDDPAWADHNQACVQMVHYLLCPHGSPPWAGDTWCQLNVIEQTTGSLAFRAAWRLSFCLIGFLILFDIHLYILNFGHIYYRQPTFIPYMTENKEKPNMSLLSSLMCQLIF